MPWVRVEEDLGVRGTEAESRRPGRAGEGRRLRGQRLGVGDDGVIDRLTDVYRTAELCTWKWLTG